MAWLHDFSDDANGSEPTEFVQWGGGVGGEVQSGYYQSTVDWSFARIYDNTNTAPANKVILSAEFEYLVSAAAFTLYAGGEDDASPMGQYNQIEFKQGGTFDIGYDGGGIQTGITWSAPAINTLTKLHFVLDRGTGDYELYVNVDDDSGSPDASGTGLGNMRINDGLCGVLVPANTDARMRQLNWVDYATGFPDAGATSFPPVRRTNLTHIIGR